jgi:Domain of unknown function (DUF4389)
MEPARADYPATFTIDPAEKVANWRPLVHWLLAIPHFLVLYALRILAQVLSVISWFAIVFTGSMPEAFANLQAMYMRYEQRVYTYAEFMREEYPPFAFGTTTADGGEDPRVRVDVTPELTDRNRLTVAFRLILVIPQAFVLFFLFLGAVFCILVAFFAVLFTGKWPFALQDYVIKCQRWYVRVEAYTLLLTDQYPPFSLD